MDTLIEFLAELFGDFLASLGFRSAKQKKADDKDKRGERNNPAEAAPPPSGDTAKSSDQPPESP